MDCSFCYTLIYLSRFTALLLTCIIFLYLSKSSFKILMNSVSKIISCEILDAVESILTSISRSKLILLRTKSEIEFSLFFAKLVIDTVKISFSFASSAAFTTSEVSPESEIKISKSSYESFEITEKVKLTSNE